MENKKILLVLGASSDIGTSFIENVHKQYDIIIAHYNKNDENLAQVKDSIGEKMHLVQADFSSKESVDGLIKTISDNDMIPTHILHLPSMPYKPTKFAKINLEEYSSHFETSFLSIANILKAFLPKMAKKKYGKILFMLTSGVLGTPPKYMSSYLTTKYALLGLMKSLSAEYADKGITVNGISPDMVDTKFLDNISEYIVMQNAENSPLGRNLILSDIVPMMEFLLSEKADCITGQNIGITGGN